MRLPHHLANPVYFLCQLPVFRIDMFQQEVHKRLISGRPVSLIVRIVQANVLLARKVIIDMLRQQYQPTLFHKEARQFVTDAVNLPQKILHLFTGHFCALVKALQCRSGTDIIIIIGNPVDMSYRALENFFDLIRCQDLILIASGRRFLPAL